MSVKEQKEQEAIWLQQGDLYEGFDEQIAEKMLKRHIGTLEPKYDKDFLRKFFAYIRNLEEPEVDSIAQKLLKEVYSKARKTYNAGVKIKALLSRIEKNKKRKEVLAETGTEI